MNKFANLIIILAVVIVIIGVIWFVLARQDTEVSQTEVTVTTPTPTPTSTSTTTANEGTTITSEGKEVNTVSEVSLIDVSGGESTGTATREFTDEFIHTVTATLPDLPEGEFYEGWLVKADSSDFFSTGKMNKSGDAYELTYTSAEEPVEYPQVVITREKTDDQQPEEHILEGSFAEMLFL